MIVIPPGNLLGISAEIGLTIFIAAQALMGIKYIRSKNIEGKHFDTKEGKKKSFLPPAAKK
jgi:hypothetical protein